MSISFTDFYCQTCLYLGQDKHWNLQLLLYLYRLIFLNVLFYFGKKNIWFCGWSFVGAYMLQSIIGLYSSTISFMIIPDKLIYLWQPLYYYYLCVSIILHSLNKSGSTGNLFSVFLYLINCVNLSKFIILTLINDVCKYFIA